MKYTTLDDIELVLLSKKGNHVAEEVLINRYRKLVTIKTRTFFLVGGDKEDLTQEGMIGLFKAIKSFDINSDASFYTFADLCISRQIMTAIKSANRKKHIPLNNSYSLNMFLGNNKTEDNIENIEFITTKETPLDIIIKKETHKDLENHISLKLTTLEKDVLYYYLLGKTYNEISLLINKDKKSIDNALQRLRKKMLNIKGIFN